jgi:hypothetical protein
MALCITIAEVFGAPQALDSFRSSDRCTLPATDSGSIVVRPSDSHLPLSREISTWLVAWLEPVLSRAKQGLQFELVLSAYLEHSNLQAFNKLLNFFVGC